MKTIVENVSEKAKELKFPRLMVDDMNDVWLAVNNGHAILLSGDIDYIGQDLDFCGFEFEDLKEFKGRLIMENDQ